MTEFERSLEVLQAVPDKDGRGLRVDGPQLLRAGRIQESHRALEKAVARWTPGIPSITCGRAALLAGAPRPPVRSPRPGYASKARQYFREGPRSSTQRIWKLRAISSSITWRLRAFSAAAWIRRRRLPRNRADQSREGYWAQAKLAEKRKEFSSAEEHLRRAVELAPQQVGRLIDLAHLSPSKAATRRPTRPSRRKRSNRTARS